MYLSSLVLMNYFGHITTLGFYIIWIVYSLILLLRLLLDNIQKKTKLEFKVPAFLLNSKTTTIGLCIALPTIIFIHYGFLSDLRVRFSKDKLHLVAQFHLRNQGTTLNDQRIGLLNVEAITSDHIGIWFRTYQHSENSYGVMFSRSGKAPRPSNGNDLFTTRNLGDGWYTYALNGLD